MRFDIILRMRNKKLIILLSIVTGLVLMIIICGATFLVRHIEAYNYYENSPDYDEQVIEASGIKKNGSIFFIDEVGVKNRVENAYPNIGVVNIERKFPDRVSVNYVVYENMFQYLSGESYCQCYSSGRIGSTSTAPLGGYFILKPKYSTETKVGELFQSADGYDNKLVTQFISYLRSTALTDKQIPERIDFVDLTRSDYFYIRTKAGCSIEIHGTGDDFVSLLDDAWSIFVDPAKDMPVNKSAGTIRTYISKSDPDNPKIMHTYSPTDGEAYYQENYISRMGPEPRKP